VKRFALSVFFLAAAWITALGLGQDDGRSSVGELNAAAPGCLSCHTGIEAMHPEAELSCIDCHGGDGQAMTQSAGHVTRPGSASLEATGDESVAGIDENLAWRRFKNPFDLRVAERVCGDCHMEAVEGFFASLHGTTAGHLSDGFYEMGLSKKRGSRFGVFAVNASDVPEPGGELERLVQLPAARGIGHGKGAAEELASHYADLPRKECMQCHFWGEGRAVDGRAGFDGDYRGEGCAACHVTYGVGGFSQSADRVAQRNEPGHPLRHTMTVAPPTETCTSCHYGDASIGLSFRGLAQLPPGATGGPDIPGTTDTPLNRSFYLDDLEVCPPDVHFERGMHCIDCHTVGDVMGDGKLHGQMEQQVEISCEACHGTFGTVSALMTERGTPLENLRREEDPDWTGEPADPDRFRVVLTGKVDGVEHEVVQVAQLVDPDSFQFNATAAEAMTDKHANVECYTCHAGWNVNLLGFHFSRNESMSQLDLLSGRRTQGRVTTTEKVFASWKSFYAGLNEAGRVAPYMTGFSTMGSVWDKDGKRILDQVMPETAAGLSGMSMVHHQTHTVRPTARDCVECHRAPGTWGLGTPNFKLARGVAFVADVRGVEAVELDRAALGGSRPLAKLPLPNITAMALECDPLQGRAQRLFVAEGYRGVHVLDVSDPRHMRHLGFVATIEPGALELDGDHLYVADGPGGLAVLDVTEDVPVVVGRLPMFDARDVDVVWPWAYVADGAGGLAIADVRAPVSPRLLGGRALGGTAETPDMATHVEALFQYSRPLAKGESSSDRRTTPRNVAAVLDQNQGLLLIDVTEPTAPERLWPPVGKSAARLGRDVGYRALRVASHVDVAETQGGSRTRESDYAYVVAERQTGGGPRSTLLVMDISDPERPKVVGDVTLRSSTEGLEVVQSYNPPFLQSLLMVPGGGGVRLVDVGLSKTPSEAAILPAIPSAFAVAVEAFPLDAMVRSDGSPLKDISHEPSRWLRRSEFESILTVDRVALGLFDEPAGTPNAPGITARLYLDSMDADHSGALDLAECGEAISASVDLDGNGWVGLGELAELTGALVGARTVVDEKPSPRDERKAPRATQLRAALAELLDGTDPVASDRNRDERLDAAEAERAVFGALDLDGDDRVSMGELSRLVGQTRRLRFGDGVAEELFAELDPSGDGRLTLREFALSDELFAALDVDGDGSVQLPVPLDIERIRRGDLPPPVEWPTMQPVRTGLPPIITTEQVLLRFDRDGDGSLSRSELKSRLDLFMEFDRNGDDRVTRDEVARIVRLVEQRGVAVTADEYEQRWDGGWR